MTRFALDRLAYPIVQAPLAGGPSTPALAAAVSAVGGLGFLATGYKTPEAVEADVDAVREITSAPFGVNVFAAGGVPAEPAEVDRYAGALQGESDRLGVALGVPRFDDDEFVAKVELLRRLRPAVVSFTFAIPDAATIASLQAGGIAVWITITTVAEAKAAADAGADALVVQGFEAGGHRGTFDDAAPGDVGLLPLLQLVAAATPAVPLVAAGGVATGAGVAAVLAAGAAAAQLGSAFMLTPEAGTSQPHRTALAEPATTTALTRAFSGRTARGIVNRFLRDHDAEAPRGYPEVHHMTAPLRAAARERGDADAINLWAGQAHALAEPLPAGELVERLAADARTALRAAVERTGA
ncbi:nitronate monooxygenase [Conexibacter sp. CPCC 206217]|uniref:nitronate monooxygenase n=1 Tax=Conexibacter sp. CPCC 206217 TaxID=3064574 RepID=UPI0027217C8C|nr:nitronate monooxygenase [Conexibacter sp. CPCC 206217]MDO8212699.1 nitronate monooxygenase [Conexibacter sp. CPCC 206217]